VALNHAKRMTTGHPVPGSLPVTMLEADSHVNPAPSPDAVLPALDADQLRVLRAVGSEWSQGCNSEQRALPVDPSLGSESEPSHATRSGRFVHVNPAGGSRDELEATLDDDAAGVDARTLARRFRRAVLGPPLKSTAIVQERMRKLVALPVLSADALSSVAYGPEAMLAVLVLAGGAGLGWSLPIEDLEPLLGEADEVVGGVVGEGGDMCAREMVLGGPALLAAAPFGLAA